MTTVYLPWNECIRLAQRERSVVVEPVPGRPDTWAVYVWHRDIGERLFGWVKTTTLIHMTSGTGLQAFHGMPRRRWRRPRRKLFWRRRS